MLLRMSVGILVPILLLGVGAGAEQSKAEPKAPPAALQAKTPISLEMAGRPLKEVLARVNELSGVETRPDEDLAEQKVTVRFEELPLSEAARALAAAVDADWHEVRRDGRHAEIRLQPSERREARLRLYRLRRAAAEAQRDSAALVALRKNMTEEPPQFPPGEPEPFVRQLRFRPQPIFPLIRALPEPVITEWLREANESFPTRNGFGPDKTPGVIIPVRAMGQGQKRIVVDFLEKLAEEESARGGPAVQELQVLAHRPEVLQVEVWAIRSQSPRGLDLDMFLTMVAPRQGWQYDCRLARTNTIPLEDPAEEFRNLVAEGASDEHPRQQTDRLDLVFGDAREDHALLEIARAAKLNLAGDSFTKPGAVSLMRRAQPLGDLLLLVERQFELAHFWMGSTLVLRSRKWTSAADREPPAEITDLWDRVAHDSGRITLPAHLRAAAGLSDPQIVVLGNHTDVHGVPVHQTDVVRLARYRHVLRGYAALTGGQRRQAETTGGLPVARLSGFQAQAWRRALRPYSLVTASLGSQEVRLRIVPARNGAEGLPTFLLAGLPGLVSVDLVSPSGL